LVHQRAAPSASRDDPARGPGPAALHHQPAGQEAGQREQSAVIVATAAAAAKRLPPVAAQPLGEQLGRGELFGGQRVQLGAASVPEQRRAERGGRRGRDPPQDEAPQPAHPAAHGVAAAHPVGANAPRSPHPSQRRPRGAVQVSVPAGGGGRQPAGEGDGPSDAGGRAPTAPRLDDASVVSSSLVKPSSKRTRRGWVASSLEPGSLVDVFKFKIFTVWLDGRRCSSALPGRMGPN
jgi:hypothetical protein